MRTLKDSISQKLSIDSILEKLSVDDIKLIDFPKTKDVRKIVDFLRKENFIRVSNVIKGNFNTYFNKFSNRILLTNPYSHWIRFADTSNIKISKNNPVFALIYDDGYNIESYWIEYGGRWRKEVNETVFYDYIKKAV